MEETHQNEPQNKVQNVAQNAVQNELENTSNALFDFELTNHFVEDNARKNTIIGKFFVKNDTTKSYQFELLNAPKGLFKINHQGQLILSKSRLNAKKNPLYTLRIRAMDSQDQTYEKEFDILVRNSKQIQDQEITMPQIQDQFFNVPAFKIQATSSAQQPITFLVEGAGRLIQKNKIKLTGVGEVRVTATASANDQYASASVTQVFRSKKAFQTVEMRDLGELQIDAPPISLQASASSHLPVKFEVEGVAQIKDNQLVLDKKEGEVILKTIQEGSIFYESAQVERRFEIHKKSQKIEFQSIGNQVLGGKPLALVARADSELPIKFEILAGNAEVQDHIMNLRGAGWVKVKATQEGNEIYEPAESVTQEFSVKSLISIVYASARPKVRRGESINVHFSVTKNLTSDNRFQLILSNSKGDFQSDTHVLGTISNTERAFRVQIPNTIPVGTNYRMRVESTTPQAHSLPTETEMVVAFSNQRNAEEDAFQNHLSDRRQKEKLTVRKNILNVTPAKRYGRYTVELDKNDIKILEIKILNPSGNKVFEASYREIVGYRERVDLSQVPVGDYKVQVMADQKTYTKNFRVE